jgi:5S rRNA maturation endonuclease (ribonuclease M5)
MRSKRNQSQPKTYFLPRAQLEDLLRTLGVVVVGDTSTDLLCYCPFHHNRDSPAFNISLSANHLWKCHNGKCAVQGNIVTLLTMKGYSKTEAQKIVLKGIYEVDDLVGLVQELMKNDDDTGMSESQWLEIDPGSFQRADEANGNPAYMYLQDRGIVDSAYEYFQLGYSARKHMLCIPVFEEFGSLAGVVGRELATKRYQYSNGLSRSTILWNLNNARSYDSVVLTEGTLDSIYIWQAGWENVCAVFGSTISPAQWNLLRKYFSEVICFFDNDEPGIKLRDSVIESVRDISVSFVEYPESTEERKIKDPGDLSPEEIRYMLENRTSSLNLLLGV